MTAVSEYIDFHGDAPEPAREAAVTAVEDLTAAWDLELDRYFEEGEGIETHTAPSDSILAERPSSGYRTVRIPIHPDTDKKRSAVYEEFGEALSHEPVGGRPAEAYTDLIVGEMFGALARHVAPTGRIESGIEEQPRVELIAEDLYGPQEVDRLFAYDTVLAELETDLAALADEDDMERRVEEGRAVLDRIEAEVPALVDPDPDRPPSLTAHYLDEFNVALGNVAKHLRRHLAAGELVRPQVYAGTLADFRRRYERGMAETDREDIEAERRRQVQNLLAREGVFGGHIVGGRLAQHVLDQGEDPADLVRMTTAEILDEYDGFVAATNQEYGITDELVEEYFRPQLLLQADNGIHPADHHPAADADDRSG